MRPGALARALAVAVLVASCNSSQPSGVPGSNPTRTGAPGATGVPPGSSKPAGQASAPTSVDLIRAALDRGRIDAQTAMKYRGYALFGAPGPPAEFRGPNWTEDDALLDLAKARLDVLPAELADAIRPFLVRPTDPGSVFFASPASAGASLVSARVVGRGVRAVLALLSRHPRTRDVERQQLSWVVAAIGFVGLAMVGGLVLGSLVPQALADGIVTAVHAPDRLAPHFVDTMEQGCHVRVQILEEHQLHPQRIKAKHDN